MLNMKMLIISSFFSLVVLTITSSVLLYKFPRENHFKYFTLFSIFFLIGEILTSFRNVISDILSIVIGNTFLITGYIFLYIGVRALLNLEAKWHNRYLIPIGIILFGLILFTYIHYDVSMRIVIFSIFCILYGSIISWIFWKNATKRFKVLDYISALLFFIGVVMFVIRALKASTIELSGNYLSVTNLMITSVYVYLFFITIWLTIILIIRARQVSFNKNTNI
jgi:hypothetical protein